MDSLHQIYARNGSDKGSDHSYIEYYEELLKPYRSANAVLEIGLFRGESLLMWEAYFYKADVYGVDCDEQPHGGMADLRGMIASGKHNIHIFDATNISQAEQRFKIKFDVIIEDASHDAIQQVQLYNLWKNFLTPNGIYIIEDIQDLDKDRKVFENLDAEKNIEIVDRRQIKNRYDDALVIIRDK